MTELHVLAILVGWTWLGLLFGSLFRNRGFSLPGMWVAFSNRDEIPPPSRFAKRFDRLANNMNENLVLFTAALLAARGAGVPSAQLTFAAWFFLGARVVYLVVGSLGIPVVRTLVWSVSLWPIGQFVFWTLRS